jgi:citrate synthase
MTTRRGLGMSTNVGRANAERIELRGHDLVGNLIGSASYTETLLLAVTGRRPSGPEIHVVDAVLVSLVDHGMQPSALAARLTYAAAPDAVQGALAAGLLGAGSSLLGSMEQAGKLLHQIGAAVSAGTPARTAARQEVARVLGEGRRVPGFGHALHRDGDPRARKLLRVAQESGVAAEETAWLSMVGAEIHEQTGRRLEVNATGAAAAILLGVGIPWRLHRGVAIVSRAAGLLAHIGEESEAPITPRVREALREASWLDGNDPAGGDSGGYAVVGRR